MASLPTTRATSTAVDLSRLPPPDVIEPLDFEAINAALRADFVARFPEFSASVESDPIVKLIEAAAYRELVLRARINDAARANLIAYATGPDLENLAAFFGVTRQEISPADPQAGTPAIVESDDELRRRVLLAPDSFSVAGPASAYVYHALTADARVLDASATSPAPGDVVVSLLAREGDGTAPQDMIDAVEDLLAGDEVRPLTDRVTVQSAGIVTFDIDAQLVLYAGPDQQLIEAEANRALDDLLTRNRRIGRDITQSAIIAALMVGGVQRVELVEPAANVVVDDTQAAAIGARSVQVIGFDE